jgi:hypothetical protein
MTGWFKEYLILNCGRKPSWRNLSYHVGIYFEVLCKSPRQDNLCWADIWTQCLPHTSQKSYRLSKLLGCAVMYFYGQFSDAVSVSTLHSAVWWDDDWMNEECLEGSVVYLIELLCLTVFWRDWGKSMKKFKDSRCPDWDTNQARPEYMSEASSLEIISEMWHHLVHYIGANFRRNIYPLQDTTASVMWRWMQQVTTKYWAELHGILSWTTGMLRASYIRAALTQLKVVANRNTLHFTRQNTELWRSFKIR